MLQKSDVFTLPLTPSPRGRGNSFCSPSPGGRGLGGGGMFILLCLIFFSVVPVVQAYDTFHPEAYETLEKGKVWVKVFLKRHQYKARTVTRAWYPFPANDVWMALTDTNNYKSVYSDYSDSRTLDKNQFDLVVEKKPTNIKGFYELIGGQEFPSHYRRRAGRVWVSYIFQRFDLPWPLNDRWAVSKIKNDESKARRGKYRYEYESPVGNFKTLKGYWELVPVPGKPGWTEFRGEYESDPGIQYPQFLAKKIFKSSMRRSVKAITKVLEEKKGIVSKKGKK